MKFMPLFLLLLTACRKPYDGPSEIGGYPNPQTCETYPIDEAEPMAPDIYNSVGSLLYQYYEGPYKDTAYYPEIPFCTSEDDPYITETVIRIYGRLRKTKVYCPVEEDFFYLQRSDTKGDVSYINSITISFPDTNNKIHNSLIYLSEHDTVYLTGRLRQWPFIQNILHPNIQCYHYFPGIYLDDVNNISLTPQ